MSVNTHRINVNAPSIIVQPHWVEPVELFAGFAGKPHCVWLDSATTGGSISIMATEPSEIFRSKGQHIEIISTDGTRQMEGDPFAVLRTELARHQTENSTSVAAGYPLGAAIGYFGYDLKQFVEELPATAVDDVGLPDCWFGFYDELTAFDHTAKQVVEVGRDRRARRLPLQKMSARPAVAPYQEGMTSNFTRESYAAAVLRAKEYIAAGDIYQVNLSQRFQCDVDATPADLYLALRKTNPAPYCAYLDIGEAQILSSSPECFLNIRDRHVVTRPIKGTRARGQNPGEDSRIAQELLASPKDNAELLMITDLERNDFGKVCQFGSVRVSELVRVEQYATVMHLVSTVEGVLRTDVSHVDCVRACFPGGSITGAPKIRAMQIIDELEPHARGIYTGAIGYFGYNGLSHLNIAIRTAVYKKVAADVRRRTGRHVEQQFPSPHVGSYETGHLTFHAGGGIVTDSEPDTEYEETLAKAQGIIDAIDQLRLR